MRAITCDTWNSLLIQSEPVRVRKSQNNDDPYSLMPEMMWGRLESKHFIICCTRYMVILSSGSSCRKGPRAVSIRALTDPYKISVVILFFINIY